MELFIAEIVKMRAILHNLARLILPSLNPQQVILLQLVLAEDVFAEELKQFEEEQTQIK